MGCRLLDNPPPFHRKLILETFAGFELIKLVAGGRHNSPGTGKSGTHQTEPTAQSGRRILIIEDDPLSLELYATLLEFSGYAVVPAVDGEEGLAVARRENPDLIICDVKLPKLGGCEVVRDLKANPSLRQIPIIAVTALDSVGDRERLLAAGFDGYIAKPIVAQTFTRQIVSFLPEVQ